MDSAAALRAYVATSPLICPACGKVIGGEDIFTTLFLYKQEEKKEAEPSDGHFVVRATERAIGDAGLKNVNKCCVRTLSQHQVPRK